MLQEFTDNDKSEPKEVFVERILQRAGRHHFAFLRAYLEGLNLSDIARRYLESAITGKVSTKETLNTLQWIRKDLSALAKRHGKFAFARVINIEPEQLQAPSTGDIPTLEQYREERDPFEMYSEADLIELFQEEFGAGTSNPKQERNARLVKKQNEALSWLEGMVSINPTLRDHVDAWLVPAIANRLIDHGISTIGALIDLINGKGQRWYVGINQLGEISSARIIKWLKYYESDLGHSVGMQALVKRSEISHEALGALRQKEHGIVPIEYFQPKPELDGSQGENRGLRNKSGKNNDYDAIHLWLQQAENPSTFRSYRKEAERFLLWSILERGKPLSSLMTEDCTAYRNFLRDLGRLDDKAWSLVYKHPQSAWMGKRGTQRWSTLWRPFENPSKLGRSKIDRPGNNEIDDFQDTTDANDLEHKKTGALSPASQKLSHTILKSLCEYLTRQRYLDFNPWDGVNPPSFKFAPNAHRSFTQEQWEFIINHLETFEKDANYVRLRFLLHFAYGTGLRISEIASSRLSQISQVNLAKNGGVGWIIEVVGKGSVKREVAMNSKVISELRLYLNFRGLEFGSEIHEDLPIIDVLPNMQLVDKIRKVKRIPGKTMSINRINEILKEFFKSAARAKMSESRSDARHMYKASTHWLRHTCGSHAAANGVDVQVIQSQFGHKSIDTTTIYVTTERDTKIKAFEKISST